MTTLCQIAEHAARAIVARYRVMDPTDELSNIDFTSGQSSTNQSSDFRRQGTSSNDRQYVLPAFLSSLIQGAATYNPLTPATATAEGGLFQNLLGQSASAVPGANLLSSIQQIDPTTFNGSEALTTMAERNPYSSDWESSTSDLYNRVFTKARAEAQSGPENVRGGTARQGFELADVDTQQSLNRFKTITDNQQQESGLVQEAIKVANTIESMRRGSQMQAQGQQQMGETQRSQQSLEASLGAQRARANNAANLQMASEFLGSPRSTTTDNLSGQGNQIQNSDQSGMNAGFTCCFIFLEALNGTLPPCVRRGRDEQASGRRVAGYTSMAKWLVPLMQRYALVRWLVNWTMVRPFITFGEWYYEGRRPWAVLLAPVCVAWLWTWWLISIRKEIWPNSRT